MEVETKSTSQRRHGSSQAIKFRISNNAVSASACQFSYLHAVESLAIPLASPLSRHRRFPKLHKYHVSVDTASPDHPEMTDLVSSLFTYEPQEIGRCQIGWNGQDAQSSAVTMRRAPTAIS